MTGLTIGSETFKIEVEGDLTKPALLLSNALGTDLSLWDGQIPDFRRHFRLIRYDPRGHGGSTIGDSPVSIAQLGKDVLAILDSLEVETAHFLGLSMGGAVGIWLLVNAPERIDRAVLVNTAPRLGSTETWNKRITAVLGGGLADNAAETIERWFSTDFAEREPERVRAIYDMLCNASPHGYANACAALRDMDLRATLQSIEQEVLIISGRDDATVPPETLSAFVAGIGGARHVVLESRHIANIEAQADFNAAVIAFLTQPKRKAAAKAKPPASPATVRKPAPMKRGGAGRRSNAARSPLKKEPTKRAPTKKSARAPVAKKKAEAHRRPASKRNATRRATTKTAAKRPARASTPRISKPPISTPHKATATRRATPTAKARGSVAKTKTTKRAAKATAKKPAKATTKKLPVARRKPARKPRRPTGRRKT